MLPYRRKSVVLTLAIAIFGTLVIFIIFATRLRLIPKRLCDRFGDILYFNQTTGNWTCFPSSDQGPCPPDMILTSIPNNHSVGSCVCDNIKDGRRVLLYHKHTKKCHAVFTQGFCKQDEWVTVSPRSGENIAVCTPNICLNQILSGTRSLENNNLSSEWVPLVDGSCVILGSRHESCHKKEEVIRFFKQKLYPACSYKMRQNSNHRTVFGGPSPGVSVPQTDCPEGYFKTELGCAVEFDSS